MMNKAITELKEYSLWRTSIDIIPQRITEIEEKMIALGGGGADSPVMSSGNKREERLVAYIDEKNELERTLEINKAKQKYIEKGLSMLTDTERKVLEVFYMSGMKYSDAMEKLVLENVYSESQIERIKADALRKYSLCVFGR